MTGGNQVSQRKPFTFVEYEAAGLPADPTVRGVIRRHAMRNVAKTRRQRDNYGKRNLRQLPIWVVEPNREAISSNQPLEALPRNHNHGAEKDSFIPAQIMPAVWQHLTYPSAPFPMSSPEADITKKYAILNLVESLIGLHIGADAQSSPTLRLELCGPQLSPKKMLLSFILNLRCGLPCRASSANYVNR